ncbi:phosphoserine aminotransferase [Metschnikowia bicuspidata var. bicuspidata NRRL YB-4993]|uniref:phosphoserine transaminase n=1 Tax=Metschnikowia bicuspidata var. bicuspidata NRRL YB-4993 TaxID=869754 RepID=A0A1A0GZB4_9ASCO|nr:phosphoserine aminotransferase [Metschnikowia bicuspidata var. bicuspidata NRRL YB-4993]OBA17035.1 phosphoserine aminotransferase [Metschnikowia bicuspidata var. bicuspidata NRRL YB-4993]
MSSLNREEPHYFGAGPALLPSDVLKQAALDLLTFDGENLGVGEISHRSKTAIQIIDETKANFTKLLNIPDTHEVFFMQGGGTLGFASVAYNLLANYAKKTGKKGKAAYAVTGGWSKKAAEEAKRLGFEVDIVVDTKTSKFNHIPPYSEWAPIDKENTAYLYVCDNETVHGNEFNDVPGSDYLPENVELVADMSSNILSKKLDVSKYGLIMAGAQKNVGLAGLTVYIIKKNLLDQSSDDELRELGIPLTPIAFQFPTVVANNSAYNTIPIFTCHILKLVTEKLLKMGGIEAIETINEKKASSLYGVLEKYPQLYKLPVEKNSRSKMNVVFTLPNEDLESKFLKGAAEDKLTGLKGHRSVGGIRASLYNAVTADSTERLVKYIENFANDNA